MARSEWLTLPTSSIERLWVYRGGRRAVGRGLRIGALAGVTGGTVIGALLSGCGDCSRVPSAGTGAIFFGGLGAMTGLIVGSLIKTGPWYEAGWPAEVDVSLDFRARFQVSMSIMVDRRD